MANIQKTAKPSPNGWWNEDTREWVITGIMAIPSVIAGSFALAALVNLYTGWFF